MEEWHMCYGAVVCAEAKDNDTTWISAGGKETNRAHWVVFIVWKAQVNPPISTNWLLRGQDSRTTSKTAEGCHGMNFKHCKVFFFFFLPTDLTTDSSHYFYHLAASAVLRLLCCDSVLLIKVHSCRRLWLGG